jgi:hypothetical protein
VLTNDGKKSEARLPLFYAVFASKHHNQNPRIEERDFSALWQFKHLPLGFQDRYIAVPSAMTPDPIILGAIHFEPNSRGTLTLHSTGNRKDSMLRRTTREVTSPVTREIDYP